MVISPNLPLIDSTSEQWTIDGHFLKVHAAIMNQIAQVTSKTLVLDEVLHSIALQLRDALQVSGCLIVQSDSRQKLASSDTMTHNPKENSLALAKWGIAQRVISVGEAGHSPADKGSAPAMPLAIAWRGVAQQDVVRQSLTRDSLSESSTVNIVTSSSPKAELIASNVANVKRDDQQVLQTLSGSVAAAQQESLVNACCDFHKHYHSWLAKGKPVILPVIQGELPPALQDSAKECGLSTLLIVPMLHQQSYIGSLMLYQREQEREWTSQEIAFVKAIASHCAIALTLAELEQRCQIQLKKCQASESAFKQSQRRLRAIVVQNITERRQTRFALQKVNEVLEIQVAERTDALKEANNVLRAEIERQKAEDQLKESVSLATLQELERFRNLVETSSDWVWEMDENTTYTYASPKVKSLLGYEPSEIIGKTPLELMPLEEHQRVADLFAPIAASRQPFNCLENTNFHKDGHLVILERSGVPIFDAKGTFQGYRGIDRDITKRKQAEEDVRKALVKEKELAELKSRFVFMTSHEFRTPLTTIQSSAELLEHYSQKWPEEKKLTHLHRIQTVVKHMTRLLNDVLIIGKAEAGKLQLNLAPLDLENFCRNLVEELQFNNTNQHQLVFTTQGIDQQGGRESGVGSREVNYSWASLPNSPLSPEESSVSPHAAKLPCMDEKLLRHILENLLSNAIKYSPFGSIIAFTLRYLDDLAIFEICDRGIGIPVEAQQRLFEPFHRATNVGSIAGTGLGLAIVKKCVDIHQGQITVESEVGIGTTFTVTLPMYNWLVP